MIGRSDSNRCSLFPLTRNMGIRFQWSLYFLCWSILLIDTIKNMKSTHHNTVGVECIVGLCLWAHISQFVRFLQRRRRLRMPMFMRRRRLLFLNSHVIRIWLVVLLFHMFVIGCQIVLRKVADLLEHARQVLGHHLDLFLST